MMAKSDFCSVGAGVDEGDAGGGSCEGVDGVEGDIDDSDEGGTES